MGAFGSVLGGMMTIGGLFLAGWSTWVITESYLLFLLFPFFGLLGGWALGYLNSRKARTQEKYKNEYTAYAAMAFMAIIMLGVYFFFFALDGVEDALADSLDLAASAVVGLAIGSGILIQLGLGLVVANSLAENRSY